MQKTFLIILSIFIFASPVFAEEESLQKSPIIKKQYIVGILLPSNGKYKKFGKSVKQGIEFALMTFSANYPNINLKLIFQDTKGDANSAKDGIDKIVQAGGHIIIGPIVTTVSAAIYAEEKKIPIITLTREKNITNFGSYVFRNFLTYEMQMSTLVEYVTKKLNIKNFAVLHPNDKYGKQFLNIFCWEIYKQNGEIIKKEAYNTRQTDFSKQINKLYKTALKKDYEKEKEDENFFEEPIFQEQDTEEIWEITNKFYEIIDKKEDDKKINRRGVKKRKDINLVDFDAIFIPDVSYTARLIIPQLSFYDLTETYILGTNLWHTENMKKIIGKSNKKIIFTDAFFKNATPETIKFSAKFKNIFGTKPAFLEAISYDTIGIIYSVLNSYNKLLTKDEIRDAILKVKNYNGITGKTTFAENGDTFKSPYLITINKNKFELVK